MNEVKQPKKPLAYYYGIVLLLLLVFNWLVMPLITDAKIKEVDYGTFMSMTEQKNIGRVEIEDNGKGIAQKDLQKIFERFYRTDASRNSAQGGSGIGLSIVKKIIEDHGGYVWATAKEGEGTCMHFVLRKYIELQPGGTK